MKVDPDGVHVEAMKVDLRTPVRGVASIFKKVQITKTCLVSDKYRSEVALKIDKVKDQGVWGEGCSGSLGTAPGYAPVETPVVKSRLWKRRAFQ